MKTNVNSIDNFIIYHDFFENLEQRYNKLYNDPIDFNKMAQIPASSVWDFISSTIIYDDVFGTKFSSEYITNFIKSFLLYFNLNESNRFFFTRFYLKNQSFIFSNPLYVIKLFSIIRFDPFIISNIIESLPFLALPKNQVNKADYDTYINFWIKAIQTDQADYKLYHRYINVILSDITIAMTLRRSGTFFKLNKNTQTMIEKFILKEKENFYENS